MMLEMELFLNEHKNNKDIDYLKAIFGDKDRKEIEKEINKLKNRKKQADMRKTNFFFWILED